MGAGGFRWPLFFLGLLRGLGQSPRLAAPARGVLIVVSGAGRALAQVVFRRARVLLVLSAALGVEPWRGCRYVRRNADM